MDRSDKLRWDPDAVDYALAPFAALSKAVPGNQRTAHTRNGGAKRRGEKWIATYTAIKANGVNRMFVCYVEKRGGEPVFVLFDADAARDPGNSRDFEARAERVFAPDGLGEALDAWREVAARAGADEITAFDADCLRALWAGSPTDDIEADIADTEAATGIGDTTRRALVDARRGQGRFRDRLMRRWGGACAVTGLTLAQALRASHAKPWRESSDAERLDPKNGILLAAHLDALFDTGLVSFADDGAMVVAPAVSAADRDRLGIPRSIREPLDGQKRAFMAHHRASKFRE